MQMRPEDGDSWTEDSNYLGKWIAASSPKLSQDTPKGNGYSIEAETGGHARSVTFNLNDALNSMGQPELKLSEFNFIHFYFKAIDTNPDQGGILNVYTSCYQPPSLYENWFIKADGNWQEIVIDLSNNNLYRSYMNDPDCYITNIEFRGFNEKIWIDNLYFYKKDENVVTWILALAPGVEGRICIDGLCTTKYMIVSVSKGSQVSISATDNSGQALMIGNEVSGIPLVKSQTPFTAMASGVIFAYAQ